MVKKNGFTFAEVLISLFVLASSMYVLSNAQFKSIRWSQKNSRKVELIFPIKKALYESYLTPPEKKPIKISLEQANVDITTYKNEINAKKSSLKDFAKSIDIIWSEGEWKDGPDRRSLKMISFVLKKRPETAK